MRNCTLPVGMPPPGSGVTVAVKDTGCPKLEDASEDSTRVVVLTGSTRWSSVPLLELKFPLFELYSAVRFLLLPVP